MLYVFHVDTGTMMTFDMNLAMNTVSALHSAISHACHIPEDKQVLLISGGQSLDPGARVCSYSAGTDSNPIYLFSKTTIEAATPPSPSVHYGSDIDLHEQVEGSLIMPPSNETVVSRTQLSLQFHEIDRDELRACEHLVHDQHIQQQGWAAVVANLEDITSALRKRSDLFQSAYKDYLMARPDYTLLLHEMTDTLELLAKIPLIRTLLPSDAPSINLITSDRHTPVDLDLTIDTPTHINTLYDWISSQDTQNSLESMVDLCVKATEQFDEGILTSISADVDQTFDSVANQTMKEVKGLEDRLYGLDQIMCGAKRIVQEQSDISQGFVKNQNRVTNLRDNSILPDLCASHKKQLLVLLRNHEKLRDIKKKCRLAKEELSVNLHTRLRWVMFVEKRICDIDGKIMIHHENLKRLRRRLDILRQIHDSPTLYAKLVVEVVCRKRFSSHFLRWAMSISEESGSLYEEERERRKKIIEELGKHFLHILFPGLDEVPPRYATKPPEPFDATLPNVTLVDIEAIRSAVPELSQYLQCEIIDTVRIPSQPPKVDSQYTLNVPFVRYSTTSEEDCLHESNTSENCSSCTRINPDKTDIYDTKSTSLPIPTRRPSVETFTADMKNRGAECEMVDGRLISIMNLKDPLLAESPTDVLQDFTEVSVDEVRNDHVLAISPPLDTIVVYPGNSIRKQNFAEVSQEFTTADFYIDESMPSSITDMASKVTQTSGGGDTKSTREKQLEDEMLKVNETLYKTECKLQQIVQLTAEFLKDFRIQCTEWQLFFNESSSDLQRNFFDNFATINDKLTEFDRRSRSSHMNELQCLMQEHDDNRLMYEDKLCVVETELVTVRDELSQLHTQYEECKTESVEKERGLQSQIQEMEVTYESNKGEVIKRHNLELEMEVDKVREDMTKKLNDRDVTISDLQAKILDLETIVEDTKRNSEVNLDNLAEKCRIEREEMVQTVKHDCETTFKADIKDKMEALQTTHDQQLIEKSDNYSKQLQEEIMRLESETSTKLETDVRNKMDEFYRTELELWKVESEQERDRAVKQMEYDVKQAHEIELALCREQFALEREAMQQKIDERFGFESAEIISQTELLAHNIISQEDHDAIVQGLRDNFEAVRTVSIEEALSRRELEHKRQMEELSASYEEQRMSASGNAELMKMSATAEKQVAFNEAINKVTVQRERDLEDFRQKETTFKDKETELLVFNARCQEELESLRDLYSQVLAENVCLKEDIEQTREQNNSGDIERVEMPSNILTGLMDVVEIQTGGGESDPNKDGQLEELHAMLQVKDDEIGKLQQKMMSMSMTASTQAIYQDKVSITSCSVGDIVLLCLDEKHDQYVVFTVGTTLHFLHSECLDNLALRQSEGEARKSWVLAEVTEKEYCQARKPNNRFKVPTGTKFYRVKAKPWNKDRPRQMGAMEARPSTSTDMS